MQRRSTPTYDLTFQDVLDILRLIDASPLGEVEVELGEVKLRVSRRPGRAQTEDRIGDGGVAVGPTPAAAAAREAQEAPERAPAPEPGPPPADGQAAVAAAGVAVKPPMAGTFYRAPSPGAPPFVEVGRKVDQGDTVGIVEVMKLFTPVHAPCTGTVVQVLVRDEAFVGSDQTLMVIEPAA